MTKYYHDIDDEQYEKLKVCKLDDNNKVAQIFIDLAEEQNDIGFNTCLLHLGMLMQIIAAALSIKRNEIDELMETDNNASRQRKMEIIIKELNEKINLRYEFDDNMEILKALYTYKGEGYLYIDKTKFMSLILEKSNDIESLDKI